MNYNEQLNKIGEFLSDLQEFKLLSYDEIAESRGFIDLITYRIPHFIKDSRLSKFYYGRFAYFLNLFHLSPFILDIQNAKNVLLKLYNLLSLKKLQNHGTKEDINKNFALILEYHSKTNELNINFITEWLNWLYGYKTYFIRVYRQENSIDSNIQELIEKLNAYYEKFYEKLYKIPKDDYVNNFIFLEQFKNKLRLRENPVSTTEELCFLFESVKAVLRELKKEIEKENLAQGAEVGQKENAKPKENGDLKNEIVEQDSEKTILTEKQIEVLRLLAKGFNQVESAKEIGIERSSYTNRLNSILSKLMVSTPVQAVSKAKDLKLI